MKKEITLLIAFVLSIVITSLTIFDSTVRAQGGSRRFVYDTNIVALGENQILRVTVSIISGNDNNGVHFKQIGYGQQSCGNGVCKSLVTNEVIKEILFDGQTDAIWIDIDRTAGASAVRGVVASKKPVRVSAQIINATTGEVNSHFILPYIEANN